MEATSTPYLDTLSQAELRALIERPAGPCATIFMPIERAEPGRQQAPLRLESMLRHAEEGLIARGMAPAAAHKLLGPAHQLVADQTFWAQQAAGLAIFVAAGLLRVYRLPLAFEELLVVNDHAYIGPLLPLLSGDDAFFLLALGLGGAQLFEGSRYGLRPLALEGAPAGLREALADDEFTKEPQLHSGVPGHGGERGAIFHGQGAREDTTVKQEALRYFQQIDRSVRHALGNARAPLLLAGISWLLPIYRAANNYPRLAADAIAVNPSVLRPEELHDRAWAIIARGLDRACDEAVERYRMLQGGSPALATNYLRAIVPAAYEGRVETLLVARGQQRWGSFDPGSGELVVRTASRGQHDAELLNMAAAQTILHRGAAHLVVAEQVPEAAPLAAILRY